MNFKVHYRNNMHQLAISFFAPKIKSLKNYTILGYCFAATMKLKLAHSQWNGKHIYAPMCVSSIKHIDMAGCFSGFQVNSKSHIRNVGASVFKCISQKRTICSEFLS